MTWAAALLARTKRLNVFATMHVTANHPVVAAKQIATIDEISRGRAGLNVVAGWNKPEYEALGLALPPDHPTRYRYAQEWFDVVQKIWTSEGPFDWNGEFFKLKNCYGKPQPWNRRTSARSSTPPARARAGSLRPATPTSCSPRRSISSRSKAEVAELKDKAHGVGRQVDVLTFRMWSAGRRHRRRATTGPISRTRTPTGSRSTTSSRCNSPMRNRSRTT